MAKYIYKGGGYFAGLPTRDMTEEEWKSYPEKLTNAALKQGLYKLSKPKPTKEVKDA
jgi:hypothetical protein